MHWFPWNGADSSSAMCPINCPGGKGAYRASNRGREANISRDGENMAGIQAAYIARTWPAYRTWGVSMFNIWEIYTGWNWRPGRRQSDVQSGLGQLQKPGYQRRFPHGSYEGRPRWESAIRRRTGFPIRWARPLCDTTGPCWHISPARRPEFTSRAITSARRNRRKTDHRHQ